MSLKDKIVVRLGFNALSYFNMVYRCVQWIPFSSLLKKIINI